jgi:hypothetical protein
MEIITEIPSLGRLLVYNTTDGRKAKGHFSLKDNFQSKKKHKKKAILSNGFFYI